MDSLRAFIAGVVFPSVVLPIGMFILSHFGITQILDIPILHLLPLAWGVWNIFYFAFLKKYLPKEIDLRLFINGAILGLIVALFGVFCLKLPEILGFSNTFYYAPLIGLPILYGIVWRFIVKPLNHIVGLHDR